MAMQVTKLLANQDSANYTDPEFHLVLESHMAIFRQQGAAELRMVPPELAYKHEGDLTGLMNGLGVPQRYHWLNMRLNNYDSPDEYLHTHQTLRIGSTALYERLLGLYRSKTKKTV